MFSQEFIKSLIDFLTEEMAIFLLPVMLFVFSIAIVLRVLVHYTVTREFWFSKEFHKRVHVYLDEKDPTVKDASFYVSMKLLLEKTYYELFVVRAYMKRRNPDYVMDMTDRVFLVQEGCARLVKESLRQTKHLRYDKQRPRFVELTKNIFDNNVCFKKMMGIIPVQATHDVLNILPGMFIIGGIFGTFLGIMGALPELGNMKLEDVEGAKVIMDNFLNSIAFSMSTSIIGIIVSVLMTFANTLFDPEKVFMKSVNKVENAMELLWDTCDNNVLPENIPGFNEHRDPIEALAEDAIENQINKSSGLLGNRSKGATSLDVKKSEEAAYHHHMDEPAEDVINEEEASEEASEEDIPDHYEDKQTDDSKKAS
ncbi:MAG: hypothetical protein HON90_08975 [Halobacteriovoraceae bacterium]|jgi:hypothetical protein|nr:hypothetical protein [Halobacteriovoraceae bacterium]